MDLKAELDRQRRQVDVENFDLTLGELVRMAEANELIRAPEYQRKFRWRREDESYLIESLFLGLPVPNIYVASNPDGTWEVVDGLQRLSTLMHFMSDRPEVVSSLGLNGSLQLVGLKKLTSFNDLAFADLPTPLRLQFAKRSLRVTALSDKSDPEIRFEVFERLNRGGVILTPQEVRACIFRGQFAEMLRELADDTGFRRLVKLQEAHQNDGTREELVLKFFAYLDWPDKYDGNVKEFLNAYMRDAVTVFNIAEGKTLFSNVVAALRNVIDGPLIRGGYALTPLNQFEAVISATGRIIREGKIVEAPKEGWLNDEELKKFSTKGTNTKTAFAGRNRRAKELLLGAAVK